MAGIKQNKSISINGTQLAPAEALLWLFPAELQCVACLRAGRTWKPLPGCVYEEMSHLCARGHCLGGHAMVPEHPSQEASELLILRDQETGLGISPYFLFFLMLFIQAFVMSWEAFF